MNANAKLTIPKLNIPRVFNKPPSLYALKQISLNPAAFNGNGNIWLNISELTKYVRTNIMINANRKYCDACKREELTTEINKPNEMPANARVNNNRINAHTLPRIGI